MKNLFKSIFISTLVLYASTQILICQETYKWDKGEIGVLDFKISPNITEKHYKGIEITFKPRFYSPDRSDNWHTVIFSAEVYKNGERVPLVKDATVSKTISNRSKNRWESGFDEDIFIPYAYFNLESGNHNLEIVLKGNVDGENVEFAKKNFSLELKKKKRHKYSEQKITLKNIETNFNAIATRTNYKGIEIKFDCDFLYGFDELYNTELSDEHGKFYLSATLKDKNENIIYPHNSLTIDKTAVIPEYNKYGDKKPVDKYNKIFIPYKNINKEGDFVAKLEIKASNKDGSIELPVLFTREVEINKPISYNYSQQEFSIKNIKKTDNVDIFGQRGILVESQCYFKFASDQIRGIDTNESLKNFHFYLTIETENNADVLSPSLLKRTTKNKGEHTYFKVLEASSPKAPKKLTFKIPYRLLNLQEGEHVLKISVHATNNERDIDFGVLSSFTMKVKYPKVSINHLSVSGLEAVPGTYDVAGKNIPIVNIFVGKKSKAGKGYPDVMWMIKIGSEKVYRSATKNNSFLGEDGSYTFKSVASDAVYFKAYDRDITSRHDVLGGLNLNSGNPSSNRHIKDTSFNKIANVTLDYTKKLLPKFIFGKVEVLSYKLNGVTGIKTVIPYHIDGLHNKEELVVKPVLNNTFTSNNNFSYELLKSNKVQESNYFSITNNNYKGTIDFFIPMYQIGDFSKVSTDFLYLPYNLAVFSLCQKVPSVLKKVNDTKANIEIEKNYFNNDFMGIKIKLDNSIPKGYFNKPEGMLIHHDLGFFIGENKQGLSKKIEEITEMETVNEHVALNSFISSEPGFTRVFFIPYYKLHPLTGNQQIDIELSSAISSNGFEIGSHSKQLSFTMPKLYELQIQKYNVQIKRRGKYKYMHWEVYHGEHLINKTSPKPNESKIMKWEMMPNKIICHSQDKIHLYLFGTDKKGKESLISIWHFEGGEFFRGQTVINLGRNNKIKSGKIEFFIK